MTIDERFNLLEEAIEFFSNLQDAGERAFWLWLRKAAALSTVKGGLKLYKDKLRWDDERTEEFLESALNFAINEEYINDMVTSHNIEWEELDFYLWGFGLAKGIMEWDEEIIKWFREQQAVYDDLAQEKLEGKSLYDLIHK